MIQGYQFQINKAEIIVKGAVLVMLADTQATHIQQVDLKSKCRKCLTIEENNEI